MTQTAQKTRPFLITVIVGLTGVIFLLDTVTPVGMTLGMLYGGPVYISGWLPRRQWTLVLASTLTALTVVSHLVSPPGGDLWIAFVNRTLAIAMIWISAGLTLMHKEARAVILAQRKELQKANATLEQRVIERTEELRRTTVEKERISSELRIASDIQRSILPRTFPPFPDRGDFEIYATTIPAREMGGDFYDFFLIDAERLGIVIADVSDKGVPAAIFMAVSRSLIKATALTDADPAECLHHVNSLLWPDNDSAMFVTVFYGILHTLTGELVYSNGGHNVPYVLRGTGEIDQVDNTKGLALGVLEAARFETKKALLRDGDCLFLYTDGITEAMDREGQLFSETRLQAVLEKANGRTVSEMIRTVVTEVRAFVAGTPQSDDITALAVRYLGRQQTGPNGRDPSEL